MCIKIACQSKLHLFSCTNNKCFQCTTPCVNTPGRGPTTICCGQWHLLKSHLSICVLPGILRSLWFDPILFLGLSPLALKHVVTTHPVGVGPLEKGLPLVLGAIIPLLIFFSSARRWFFFFPFLFFFLISFPSYILFFSWKNHAFLQEWLEYKVLDAFYGILSQSDTFFLI